MGTHNAPWLSIARLLVKIAALLAALVAARVALAVCLEAAAVLRLALALARAVHVALAANSRDDRHVLPEANLRQALPAL